MILESNFHNKRLFPEQTDNFPCAFVLVVVPVLICWCSCSYLCLRSYSCLCSCSFCCSCSCSCSYSCLCSRFFLHFLLVLVFETSTDFRDRDNVNLNLHGVIHPFRFFFFSALWTEQRTSSGLTGVDVSGSPLGKLLEFRQQQH